MFASFVDDEDESRGAKGVYIENSHMQEARLRIHVAHHLKVPLKLNRKQHLLGGKS